MNGSPPGGQADDRPPALDPAQLRARAELYLIEQCGLPLHLLPSGLPDPLRVAAVELRTLALRRIRLVDRLHTAAVNLSSQSIQLIENTAAGCPPGQGELPLNRSDMAAAGDLTSRLFELDHQIRRWTGVLVRLAELIGVEPEALPGQEDK